MKLFKRILLICLAGTTALFSACFGNQTTVSSNLFAGSYWLKSTEAGGVATVNETCVYKIQFKPNVPEDGSTPVLSSDMQGTLTTALSKSAYNGVECYKFTTETVITGTYYHQSKNQTINDYACSEVYFLGLTDKLTPIYSKKYLLSTILLISNLSIEPTFEIMEYTVETVYDRTEQTATVTVKGGDKSTPNYKLEDSTKTYQNYAKSGAFFDNESILFSLRAADFSENGFSNSFQTIDALAQKIHRMNVAVNSSDATGEIEIPAYSQAGVEKTVTFPVFNVNLSISSTFSGSAINLYYATDIATYHRRLIKMQTQLAFNAGYIVYTLSSVSYS